MIRIVHNLVLGLNTTFTTQPVPMNGFNTIYVELLHKSFNGAASLAGDGVTVVPEYSNDGTYWDPDALTSFCKSGTNKAPSRHTATCNATATGTAASTLDTYNLVRFKVTNTDAVNSPRLVDVLYRLFKVPL